MITMVCYVAHRFIRVWNTKKQRTVLKGLEHSETLPRDTTSLSLTFTQMGIV